MIPILTQFLEQHKPEADELGAAVQELDHSMTRLLEWFGEETKTKWETFWSMPASFVADFKKAFDTMKAQQEEVHRKKQQEDRVHRDY